MVWITCGWLWCFYQLFGLSFWRHPFTAEDHCMSKRWNATFLQICSIKKQAYLHIWSEGDFSANFHFWVNYSFKWHLVLHNIIILQEMTTYYQRIIFFINFVMSVVLVGLCLFDQITLRSKGLEQEWYIPPFCLPFLCWMALVFSGKKEITLCIPLMCLQKINNSGCMGSGGQWWQLLRTRRRLMWKNRN